MGCFAVLLFIGTAFGSVTLAQAPPVGTATHVAEFRFIDGMPTTHVDQDPRPCPTVPTYVRVAWFINDARPAPQFLARGAMLEMHSLNDGRVVDSATQDISWNGGPYGEASTPDREPTLLLLPPPPGQALRVDLLASYWDGPRVGGPHRVSGASISFDCITDIEIPNPELPCGLTVPPTIPIDTSDCDPVCDALNALALGDALPLTPEEKEQLEDVESLCTPPCDVGSDPTCINPCPDGDCLPCTEPDCLPCTSGDCTPCTTSCVPIVEPPHGNIDISLGVDLGISGIPTKEVTQCVAGLGGSGTVNHISGEFVARFTPLAAATDMGPDLRLDLTYRSLSPYATHGAIGTRWDFNYGRHLAFDFTASPNVAAQDGQGTSRIYTYNTTSASYESPAGYYDRLDVIKVGTTISKITLTDRYGNVETYSPTGKLLTIQDRNQNTVTLTYDTSGRLKDVKDAHGRKFTFTYNTSGQMTRVADWTGRHADFKYTGSMLTGIELPEAIIQKFTYSGVLLTKIKDGEGHEYLVNQYDSYGRVARQIEGIGSTNYAYNPAQLATYVADQNGNLVKYTYDNRGLVVQKTEYTNRDIRPDEKDSYNTTYSHNANLEQVLVEYPDGTSLRSRYDETNTNPLSRGNLLHTVFESANGHDEIHAGMTYEAQYNQIQTSTSANGFGDFHPQNGGKNDNRYTTTNYFDYQEATLGDLNADGVTTQTHGNIVKVVYPAANAAGKPFPEASDAYANQAAILLFTYNDHGQVVKTTNPLGLVDYRQYFPVGHANYGFLSNITVDYGTGIDPITGKLHRNELTRGTRDALGNPIAITDPTGDTMTAGSDGLCRMTSMKMSSSTNIQTQVTWDKNSQMIAMATKLKNNQTASASYEYDASGNLVRETRNAVRPLDAPASATPKKIVYEYGYDRKSNLVLTRSPEATNGNQTASIYSVVYDERNQVYTATRGGVTNQFATLPANNNITVLASLVDRPEMSTGTNHYDAGGRVTTYTDPNGNPTAYKYDGFGRRVATIDALGNIFVSAYDPAGNVVRQAAYEHGKTASILCLGSLDEIIENIQTDAVWDLVINTLRPVVTKPCYKSDLPTYSLLQASRTSFDERGRAYKTQSLVYDPATGICTEALAGHKERCSTSSLIERDASGNTIAAWQTTDGNTRLTGRTTYDRESRPLVGTDPVGNQVTRSYNKLGQLEETKARDVNPEGWVAAKTFTTKYTYDTWGRILNQTDDLHFTSMVDYDDMGNVASRRDGNGQFTVNKYDTANRIIQESHVMRAGDNGQHTFQFALVTPGQHTLQAGNMIETEMLRNSDEITVVGPAVTLTAQGPGQTARNAAFNLVVKARDEANNVDFRYAGTVTFESTDSRAQLPADYTFVPGDTGIHTFSIKMQTVGLQTIAVYDEEGLEGYYSVLVGPGPLHHIQVLLPGETSAPGPGAGKTGNARTQIANVPFAARLRAVDDESNLVVAAPAVTWQSPGGAPTNVNLVAGLAEVQAKANANGVITATSAGLTGSQSSPLTVLKEANYGITAPTKVIAGTPFTATVTAQTMTGTTMTSYLGKTTFTSDDEDAVLPADYTYIAANAGTKQFTVTLNTPGLYHIGAQDFSNPLHHSVSRAITVEGPATQFQVTSPASSTSSSAFSVTVKALDDAGNVATTYRGAVSFTSTDTAAVLPAAYTFTAGDQGSHTFSINLKQAGNQWLKVQQGALEATVAVQVNPGALAKLQVILPGEIETPPTGKSGTPFDQQAYVPFQVKVLGLDAAGNIANTNNQVRIVSPFSAAVTPTMSNGKATATVQFTNGGTFTFTATDLTTPGTTSGVSANVVSEFQNHWLVTAPSSVQAGQSFSFTVTPRTNTGGARSFTGYLAFESPDTQATLPPQATFSGEPSRTFSATLRTSGLQAIYVYDGASYWGIAYITVNGAPEPVGDLLMEAPTHVTSGTPFTVTVRALDAYGVATTASPGALDTQSTDPYATLPAGPSNWSNGVLTYTATLRLPGNHALGASNNNLQALTYVTVDAAPATKILAIMPGEIIAPLTPTGKLGVPDGQRAGIPFEVQLVATDANGIPAPSSAVVTLTSTDTGATLPSPTALVNGVAYVMVTLSKGHVYTVNAAASGLTASSTAVRVADGQYLTLQHSSTVAAGQNVPVTATVKDKTGATITTYTGTVDLYATDGVDEYGATHDYVAADLGSSTLNFAPESPGTTLMLATDYWPMVYPRVSDVTVTGDAVEFRATMNPLVTSALQFNFDIEALDENGNQAAGYRGALHFTTTDASGIVPGPYAYTAGDAGKHTFAATLYTVGPQIIVASDASNNVVAVLYIDVAAARFSKLQILLPGETAKPGTPTGKVGTPFKEMEDVSFTVRIRAVDARWNPVSATDTVRITSTDSGIAQNIALIAGEAKITATFATSGSHTVSVADVTDTTITSNTSPSVTVDPPGHHFTFEHPDRVYSGDIFDATFHARDADLEQNVTFVRDVKLKKTDPEGYAPPVYLYTMGLKHATKHGDILSYVNVTYEYDADGRLVRQGDGSGQVMRYFYDELGRRIRTEYPDGTNSTVKYDRNNNVVQNKDQMGNVIHNTYDVLNRLVQVEVARKPGVIGTDLREFRYDGLGRVVYALDRESGTTTAKHEVLQHYDSLGRMLDEIQDTKATKTTYRDQERTITYPSEYKVTYTSDNAGRLVKVADTEGTLATYTYLGARTNSRLSGNGVNETFRYDADGHLSSLTHKKGATMVAGLAYNHYPMGQAFTVLRQHLSSRSDALELDSLYRLIRDDRGTLDAKHRRIATVASAGFQAQSWGLTPGQDWANTTTTVAGTVTVEQRSHNAVHEVTALKVGGATTTLVYDDNGNLLDNSELVLKWDYANRLREVVRKSDGKTIAKYEYDAFNRRVSKETMNIAGASYTRYYHAGDREIEEWTGKGDAAALTGRFVYGASNDEIVVLDRFDVTAASKPQQVVKPVLGKPALAPVQAVVCSNAATGCGTSTRRRYYVHQDTQMTVHAITDTSGAIKEGYTYTPYGDHILVKPGTSGVVKWDSSDIQVVGGTSVIGNPIHYAGRRFDPETGFYQVRARYYDAGLGRFISDDPVGPWGDTVNLGNAYAYVGNGPYDRTDPSGLESASRNDTDRYRIAYFNGSGYTREDIWVSESECQSSGKWENGRVEYDSRWIGSQACFIAAPHESATESGTEATASDSSSDAYSSSPKTTQIEPAPVVPNQVAPQPSIPMPTPSANKARQFSAIRQFGRDVQSFGPYCGAPRRTSEHPVDPRRHYDGMQRACIEHDNCLDSAYATNGPDDAWVPPTSNRADVQRCNIKLAMGVASSPFACLNPSSTPASHGSDSILDNAFGKGGRRLHCAAYQVGLVAGFTLGYGVYQAKRGIKKAIKALEFWA